MLKKFGKRLFDPSLNTVRLSLHIDGMPLFHSSDYNLWPILANVGKKPVFIVGLYGGKKKPRCSNQYLKPLVDEICALKKNGLKIEDKLYRLVLHNIMMDAPARSYILGVKGHTAKKCCPRCKVVGVRSVREGFSSTSGQRRLCRRKALCFLNLDAPKRDSSDFISAENAPDCDEGAGCESKQCWSEYMSPADSSGYVTETDYSNSEDEDEHIRVYAPEPAPKPKRSAKSQKASYFKHRTILTKIPGFNPLTDIPMDYMHLVCLGIMKKLLTIWTKNEACLSENNKAAVEESLSQVRDYFPAEFQRKPDLVEALKRWKATQFRSFLLYHGYSALQGRLCDKYLQNFSYLVASMRLLTKTERGNEESRSVIAEFARKLIRKFIESGIVLYGPEFAVSNVHMLIHVPDDYVR